MELYGEANSSPSPLYVRLWYTILNEKYTQHLPDYYKRNGEPDCIHTDAPDSNVVIIICMPPYSEDPSLSCHGNNNIIIITIHYTGHSKLIKSTLLDAICITKNLPPR